MQRLEEVATVEYQGNKLGQRRLRLQGDELVDGAHQGDERVQLGRLKVERLSHALSLSLLLEPAAAVTLAGGNHLHGGVDRQVVAGGPALQFAPGAAADAPPEGGVVDHSRQADAIIRVDHQAQEGQHILDLASLIELHPADKLVRHAVADERLFQRPRLRVGAIHHRALFGLRPPALHQPLDFGDHEAGLLLLVVCLVHIDG